MDISGKRAPLFYGWVIVLWGLINMVLIYGTRHGFPVFFTPILQEFGWSRAAVSSILSLNIFAYGFFAPLAGLLASRWRPRAMVAVGIIIMGLGALGCAAARQLWHFQFLYGVLMSLGAALAGWPILAPALINWFAKRRGMVLGFTQMGGGLSFAFGLVCEVLIQKFGWRNAYVILSMAMIGFLLPLSVIFFRYDPGEKGLNSYGAGEGNFRVPVFRRSPAPPRREPPWTVRDRLRAPKLWLLFFSYALFWGLGVYTIMAHQVRFCLDVGFSSIFSVSIFALSGIMLGAGQMSGFLSDWMGREQAATVASGLTIGALSVLLAVRNPSQGPLLYIHAVGFGLGTGMFAPAFFAAVAEIFPGKQFGFVAGCMLTGQGLGGVIGPWLGGYIFDISGSYAGMFILSIFSVAVACLLLWIAAPRRVAWDLA
jgi:MFS family permease